MPLRLCAALVLAVLVPVVSPGASPSPAAPVSDMAPGQPPLEALRLYHPPTAEDSVRVLEDLRRRVSRDRNDVEARRELASLISSSPSIPQRLEAAEALERALVIAPGDPDLWVRMGLLRQHQRYWSESRRALQRAWELAPDWVYLSDILAQIQLAEFQRSDREEYFEDAGFYNRKVFEAEAFTEATLKREIRLAFMRGDTVAVVDSLLEMWGGLDGRGPDYHLIRGWREYRRGDWEAAEASFERGKALMPENLLGDFFTLHVVAPRVQQLTRETPDSVRTIVDWWRWSDPTPSDLLNPRHLEHQARMVEADLLFGLERKRLRGWRHAPGEMIVRYGLPEDFNYMTDVDRHVGDRIFNTSHYQPTALLVRLGATVPFDVDFLDFAMNGTFVRSFDRSLDEFVFASPSLAPLPFDEDPKIQDIEIWRYGPPGKPSRLEIAVALPGDSWTPEVFASQEGLVTRVAVYDSLWAVVDTAGLAWGAFREDPFGRLVGSWSLDSPADSLVLGLETRHQEEGAWAGSYKILNPYTPDEDLALSDLAFYRDLTVEADSPYSREGLSAVPNPGHVYLPGEPVVLGFEAYGLTLGEEGAHAAEVSVSVLRPGRKGVLKVLMGEGASRQGLSFTARGLGTRMTQTFSLDMPHLGKGTYWVEVRVHDVAGETSVSVRDRITVAERIKR